ncbi:MAG: hypothetical protein ACJ72M_18260 [Propionibacteriaceae bacterium]|jgi:uncharacterized membrane protein YwzB
MNSTGSSAEGVKSGPTYADPTPNPFIMVSDRSSRLMLIVLVSCALTVAVTRLFLVLTGYPQIGGSTFHLAHALWGGLALFLASTMALVVQNRGAAVIIALLTGVGFGLFVDEVGKFITQKNDYFFPLAAPIVYASLLLILVLTDLARRHQLRNPRAHLLAAISLSQTVADGTATATEMTAMRNHIGKARTGSLDDASAALLSGIETSMALADRVQEPFAFAGRAARRIRRRFVSWLPVNRARRFARWALALFCVLGLFQLLLLIGVVFTPEGIRRALTLSVRDQPVGEFGKIIFLITWGLNAIVAALAGIAWWALRPKRLRRQIALSCGYGAMLLMLLLGNLLSSYVYQFAILVEVGLQVITLGLLLRWDQATRPAPVS